MFGLAPFGELAFGDYEEAPFPAPVVFLDSFEQPFSLPIRNRLVAGRLVARLAFDAIELDPFALTQPEATTPDRWFRELQTPPRYARAIGRAQQQFEMLVQAAPFPETVSAD